MTEFRGTQIHLLLINVRPLTMAVAVSSERHDNFHESFSYVYHNNFTVFRPCYVRRRHPPYRQTCDAGHRYFLLHSNYLRTCFFLHLSTSFSRQRFSVRRLVRSKMYIVRVPSPTPSPHHHPCPRRVAPSECSFDS